VPEVVLERDSGPWKRWEVPETCGIRGSPVQAEVASVDIIHICKASTDFRVFLSVPAYVQVYFSPVFLRDRRVLAQVRALEGSSGDNLTVLDDGTRLAFVPEE